jgi:hypothetical protein
MIKVVEIAINIIVGETCDLFRVRAAKFRHKFLNRPLIVPKVGKPSGAPQGIGIAPANVEIGGAALPALSQ